MPGPPVIAFDLDSDGHHPSYLHYLAQRWLEREAATAGRELIVVVARDFMDRHADVVALGTPGRVRFDPVDRPTVGDRLPGLLGPLAAGLLQWGLLARAARRHRAGHAVVMYIDPMVHGPLAMRLPALCPVSGIFFRPAFHYRDQGQSETPGEARRTRRQRITIGSAIRHRRLHTLWTLDPYAVPHIEQLSAARARIKALADPVPEVPPPKSTLAELRLRYGLTDKTTTLLLFGALSERKGVVQALEGIAAVAREGGHDLTVLLVGRAQDHFQPRLSTAIATAEAAGAKVIRNDTFVPEAHVQAHFELADVVLAPYQRHVGSSGIAIRAARAGRPLLASDYGMLGECVRREGLGTAVDARSADALAHGLRGLLAGDVSTSPEGMARFAAANTAHAFADAVIEATVGS